MSDISNWTTSAGGNNFTPPDGWPEGMAPSAVNDTAREGMAAIRRWYIDAQWVNWGHVMVRQTNNSFLVSVTATDIYTPGRRLKLLDAGVTLYAETLASGMSGANTLITISSTTNIDSSLSSGAVSILDPVTPAYRPDTYESYNAQLFVTATSNTLNVYLKGKNGADPSASNPVWFKFRSATAANGDYTNVAAVAATSVSLPAGASLGTLNGIPCRTWVVAFNDAGTVRLGLFQSMAANSLTATTGFVLLTPTAIAPLADDAIASSVSVSAGAVSSGVFYTSTGGPNGVSAKAIRIVGYVESTQAAAGTWATTPSKVQLWQPGMKLPGDIIQWAYSNQVSAAGTTTATTAIPNDNTIPTSTEGVEWTNVALVRQYGGNVLRAEGAFNGNVVTTNQRLALTLIWDGGTSAVSAIQVGGGESQGAFPQELVIRWMGICSTTGSTSVAMRYGPSAGTLNAQSAVTFGGVIAPWLQLEEILV